MAEISATPREGNFMKMIRIRTDSLTEPPFPLRSLQRLYIGPLRIVFLFKFIDRALDPFPHVARESGKLLLSFFGDFNAKAHVLRRARVSTLHV
jgi:hypothetical protein